MKRRITLSIALVLSIVLVSLMSSDSTANAARRASTSLRVRLVLRPRLVEGGKLCAGRIDGDDLGKTIERDLEPVKQQENFKTRDGHAFIVGRAAPV